MKITKTDYKAIDNLDGEYLRIKARLLENDNKEDSKEYLMLAALLGDNESIGSIGEYYIDSNPSLAIAYFNIGTKNDDILSLYNLGVIYYEGKGVEKDTELGHYYYAKAIELIGDDEEEQIKYPTLYLNAAKDIIDNADSIEALFKAYEYLDLAGDGYTAALHSGNKEYEIKFNEVNDLMDSDIFSEVRDIVERDDIYSGDDDECDEECEGHCHCHH